jgi:tetratricopeptide (TPR) repeat protein
MEDAIKRDDTALIAKKLAGCKMQLQKGNMYSCLVDFREALEKLLSTKMLAADEREFTSEINLFQQKLSDSKKFKDVYGPVSFRDNDPKTTLDFIKQLVQVKEEEILTTLEESNKGDHQEETEDRVHKIKELIGKGDHAEARELISDDEKISSILIHYYNGKGIEYRREGRYAEAVGEFKKALVVQPDDEGLYYNIARGYMESKEWQNAQEAIEEGLKINADFKEGIELLNRIQKLVNE